jgi:hypothetical protein
LTIESMSRLAQATISASCAPRIHDDAHQGRAVLSRLGISLMDCRVKPGNDSGEAPSAPPA